MTLGVQGAYAAAADETATPEKTAAASEGEISAATDDFAATSETDASETSSACRCSLGFDCFILKLRDPAHCLQLL